MNKPVPLESQEADTLMAYLRDRGLMFTHIKNETGRSFDKGDGKNWRAIWDKRDGVSKGFPDFAVVLPDIGLAMVELKRLRGSKTSPEQLAWVAALNTCPGVEARVCKGAMAAIAFIEELSPSKYGAALLADQLIF
jgi:hypothetical protein